MTTSIRSASSIYVQRLAVALVIASGFVAAMATQRVVEDWAVSLLSGGLIVVILSPLASWFGRPSRRHGGIA